jgi:DNA-binding MarR family transcriptional regulator
MRLQRNLLAVLTSETNDDEDERSKDGDGKLDELASLSSSGPLNSSGRVAILAALLAFNRATFTELVLALNLPKSSLNLSLSQLEASRYVIVKKSLAKIGGPRTVVEITPEGKEAITKHLLMMQNLAKKLLDGSRS